MKKNGSNSAHIELPCGRQCIVDASDYAWLKEFNWQATPSGNTCYVKTNLSLPSGRQTTVRMHRLIMEAPKGLEVDHINGNGLDNRRSNLRLSSGMENQQNRKKWKVGLSRYKGVTRHNKWVARIRVNKKLIHLGTFKAEVDAARAYDKAARQYFGERARVNFMEAA